MAEADEKSTQVIKLKKRISQELNEIDKDIKDMEKSKKDSVEKIEIKKVELKKFSTTQAVCDEHYATLQEIEQASKLIEQRKISITALDTTIANLDLQISKIQSEHDKAVAELEKKRRRLNDYLKYYEDLNDKLEKLIELLGEEEKKHCVELNNLKVERAKTLTRTDLSENALNKLLGELDNKMVDLNKEHGKLIESISQKLSEITVDASEVEELLSEGKKKAPAEKKKAKPARATSKEDDTGGEGDTEPETEEEVTEEIKAEKEMAKVKEKEKEKEKKKVKDMKEKEKGAKKKDRKPGDEEVAASEEEAEEEEDEVKKEVAPDAKKAKVVEEKKEKKTKDGYHEKKPEKREEDKKEDEKKQQEAEEEAEEEEENDVPFSTDEKRKGEPRRPSMEKRKRPSLTRPRAKPKPGQKADAEHEGYQEEYPPEVEVLMKAVDEGPEQPEPIDDSDYDYDSEDSDMPVSAKAKGKKAPKRVVPDIPKKPKKKKKKKKKIAEEVEEEEEERDSFDVDDEELFDWFRDKKISKDLRLDLLRQGMQITPSNRIITKDDRVLTLQQAQRLGILDGFFEDQEEEESEEESSEDEEGRPKGKKKKKYHKQVKYYQSPASSASTLGKESSESHICGRDVEYLKVVFGKSLTIALAEITAIQPIDPIHYLAHWMLKYRYNQEIDQITRIQIQELMIEQERLAAEKWHRELQEEARLAVLEALFRAENIIIQQDFQSELQLREYEGEFEESPPPIAI